MDTELIELCKEVFRRTGWESPDIYLGKGDPTWKKYRGSTLTQDDVPLYTSDYMLEKLQNEDFSIVLRWNRHTAGDIGMKAWDMKYSVGTFNMPQGNYPVADTPLKALLKLVIVLDESNQLPHEEKE